MSTIMRLTEQLNIYDPNSDCDSFDASSSSSSKDASPTVDLPSLSSSVPNICPKMKIAEGTELQFHNDYFKNERHDRLNHSFRSVRSQKFSDQSLSFESHKLRTGSLRHDFKSSASLEQVSYRCLMDSLSGNDKRKV